jgi:5-methylcytosine-specific restriction enzyme A
MNLYKTTRWESKREKILKRDQYLCQECKRYGKRIPANTVHHMHPFRERPDLRLTNWNLISFCTKCHGKMHNRETDELTPLGEQWREKAIPPLNKFLK